MARENQGLQIALIILVMLTVLLSVTTFLFLKQANVSGEKALASQDAAKKAKDQAGIVQTENNELKKIIGVAATEDLPTIAETLSADMQEHAPTLSDEKKNYREALRAAANTIEERNQSLASEQAANEALKRGLQAAEAKTKPLVEREKNRADAAEKQLAQERTKFTQDRGNLTNQQRQNLQQHLAKQKAFDDTVQGVRDELAGAGKQLFEMQKLVKVRNEKIAEILEPTFEVADGKIRWVNQANGTVWIDIGQADGLLRQTNFSVYPADTNDVTQAGEKGSIEVTQILGEHLAEARIVEDSVADPIVLGDVIHTPVWAPGDREHFVLTDGMDLDGDNKSDLQTVLNIITMNGGVVDCYLDPEQDWQRVGKLIDDTRYLVMGSSPTDVSKPARLDARRDLLKAGEQRGVKSITLDELLNKMGWKNQTPVTRLGAGSNPNDFPPRAPAGGPRVSTGTVSDVFRPRTAPRGTRGGAY